MGNCQELFDEVTVITAVPVADFTEVGRTALSPTIDEDYFSPMLTNAIVIGREPAVTNGALIPIKGRAKAKDNTQDNTAGRLHTVGVDCTVDDRDGDVWQYLLNLERNPMHLILNFRNGGRAFVHGDRDSYLCQVERDSGTTNVSFRIQNLMGIQLIVD